MVDNLALFLVHAALALLLIDFMRHDDPEDQRRKPGRFGRRAGGDTPPASDPERGR